MTDGEVVFSLSKQVAQLFWSDRNHHSGLRIGSLEVNDFSICFWMESDDNEKGKGFYIKIPKKDLYKKKGRHIFPLSEEDKILGKNEYESLSSLAKIELPDSLAVAFVKPVAFLEDYNAIITEKIEGNDILAVCRYCALRKKLYSRGKTDFMDDCLYRLGKTINYYHRAFSKGRMVETQSIYDKIRGYLDRLNSLGGEGAFLNKINHFLSNVREVPGSAGVTVTLKGLDIRNIIADRNNRFYILDPGKRKEDFPEADLARFVVTCRIIFWGTPFLFFRLSLGNYFEKMLFDGYRENGIQCREGLLRLLIIKELLKHWHQANVVLNAKRWPYPIKIFLRKTYINPFYKAQLFRETDGFGAGKRL